MRELNKNWTTLHARANPVEHHMRTVRRVRALFQLEGIRTRSERRKCLRRGVHWQEATKWLHDNPSDIWASEAEERQGWSPLNADAHADKAVERFNRYGYYREYIKNTPKETGVEEEHIEMRQAHRQFFGEEWTFGPGDWGPSKKSLEEDLGPRNERLEVL